MGISAIIQAVLFVASTAYQISQQNKMKRKQAAEADKRKGFTLTSSGQVVALPIAYGKNNLGGVAVKHSVTNSFNSSTDNSTKSFNQDFSNSSKAGSKNEFLHVQYAICQEGIEGVQWVKVNDSDYNSSEQKFKHFIRTFKNGGTADNIASANGIPSTNRFTKTAFASATFQLNRDDQNYSGVPSMNFLVKGRKVRWVEENSGVYTLSSNYIYSNNPALCLLDYLLNVDFGRGLSTSEVDLESFYNAANVCDTIVATDRLVAGQVNSQKTVHTVADLGSRPVDLEKHTYENELWYTTASNQYWYWDKTTWVETTLNSTRPIPLYECNITLDTGDTVRDNIERIMNTMGLAELTWSSEGKYKLSLEHPTTESEQNALVDSSHYFTDDNIIRESVSMAWPAASDRLNQATVTFLNEHEDFKDDSVTWPTSYSAVHNTFLSEDNNQPFQGDLSLDGITDPYHALAKAEEAVRKSRSLFSVSITVTKEGLNLEPGDFINISSEVMGITDEVFRVESIEINADFTVKLSCYKFDFNTLAWNVSDDIAYSVQPVYDFTVAPVTSISYIAGSSLSNVFQIGKLSWVDLENSGSYSYEVQFKKTTDNEYTKLGVTRATSFEMSSLIGLETTSNFDFKVLARSPAGQVSAPSFLLNQFLTQIPEDIDSLTHTEEQYITSLAAGIKNRVRVDWVPSTSGVLAAYFELEIKKSTDTAFVAKGTTKVSAYVFEDLSAGLYEVRVTPYSAQEKAGNSFTQLISVIGYSAIPGDPTGLFGNSNGGQLSLSWNLPPELDVLYGGKVQIRVHPKTDATANWETAPILVEALAGNTNNKTVPLGSGTYMIKFYDSLGNESANPDSIVLIDAVSGFTTVASFEESTSTTHSGHSIDTGWNGTLTNATESGGVVELDLGQIEFTYQSSDVNNPLFNWGPVPTTMRLSYDFEATSVVRGDRINNIPNISLHPNMAGTSVETDIRIFISVTQDDPTSGAAVWSNYRQATIGDVTARGLRYRLVARANNVNEVIQLSEINISLNKSQTLDSGITTSSSSADTTLTFPNAFFDRTIYNGNSNSPDLKPQIATQIIGGSQGDEVVVVSKGPSNFVYSVYNSGSRVVRDIDYQAVGL